MSQTVAPPRPDGRGPEEANRLRRENEELRIRLLEAEETLNAIRTGEVDAIVAIGPEGEQVFTLTGAERPYRVLIEAMQEGAATLDVNGTLLYANMGLAKMVRAPLEDLLGTPFVNYLHASTVEAYHRLFREGLDGPVKEELCLRGARDRRVHVRVSITPLPNERQVCIVVTDLSQERKRDEERDLLARLPLAVGQADDFDSALNLVLEMVGKSAEWVAGEVWIPRGETLRVHTSWQDSDRATPFLEAGRKLTQRRGTGTAGRAWAARAPLKVDTGEEEDPRLALARECGLAASIAFPVLFSEDLIAVVVFYVEHVDDVDPKLIQIVQAAVAPVAPVVQRRRVEQQVAASLREKEALLKEVHHRVKNNLQVVSAILAMQARRAPDAVVRSHLRDSEARVRSMALIHESLYQAHDLARIDFQEYLGTLSRRIVAAYTTDPTSIEVKLEVLPVKFELEMAVPMASLVNELLTNALKHAFPEGKGTVHISLAQEDEDHLGLVVADDGVGAPDGVEGSANSMGMQIVRTLVGQLGGELEVRRGTGTSFRVRVPFGKGA